MKRKLLPEQQLLHKLLTYNALTGQLFWKPRAPVDFCADGNYSAERLCAAWNGKNAGKEAFTAMSGDDARQGTINQKHYFAHRIIWKYVYNEEPDTVVAINGDKSDTRLCNLRPSEQRMTRRNDRIQKNNKTGVKGVHWHAKRDMWEAQIKIEGRTKFLGRYGSLADAKRAREKAEAFYGYKAMPLPKARRFA